MAQARWGHRQHESSLGAYPRALGGPKVTILFGAQLYGIFWTPCTCFLKLSVRPEVSPGPVGLRGDFSGAGPLKGSP